MAALATRYRKLMSFLLNTPYRKISPRLDKSIPSPVSHLQLLPEPDSIDSQFTFTENDLRFHIFYSLTKLEYQVRSNSLPFPSIPTLISYCIATPIFDVDHPNVRREEGDEREEEIDTE